MGFLSKLFGKTTRFIYAPVSGKSVPLCEVNDPAFSAGLLGKGVAIHPTEGKITAPCNGIVDTVFETGHALTLQSDFGAEILIHVGLDTVNLKGKYYTTHVKSGDKIRKGDLLLEFDLQAIQEEGYDTITPIVVCNHEHYKTFATHTGKQICVGDAVIRVST